MRFTIAKNNYIIVELGLKLRHLDAAKNIYLGLYAVTSGYASHSLVRLGFLLRQYLLVLCISHI